MIVLVLLILVASIVYLYLTRRTARSTSEHGREAEKTYESTHNSADRALRSRLGLTTQCRPVTIAVSPVNNAFVNHCVINSLEFPMSPFARLVRHCALVRPEKH